MKLDELQGVELLSNFGADFQNGAGWAAALIDSMVDGVALVDGEGIVRQWSQEATRMTGWETAAVQGLPADRVFPVSLLHELGSMRRLVQSATLVARNGREIPVEFRVGQVTMEVGVLSVVSFRDVSALQKQQEQLKKLAHYDVLTGLPNRMMLQELLPKYISMSNRYHQQVAVMFIDLDYFKPINDSHGHDIGDKVLKEIGTRLKYCVRTEDVVGRLGGDEFVALLYGVQARDDAATVADRIQGACSKPIVTDRGTFELSASIGIAMYPHDASDGLDLLKAADQAMYAAKQAGRSQAAFFAPEMDKQAAERMALKEGLRAALEAREFVLHYQPQIDLVSKKVLGAEALIRWVHPSEGMIPPGKFIPVAEESNLIIPIGEWALREACREAKRWLDLGLNDGQGLMIGVNLSTRQFTPSLPNLVFSILKETGLPPHLLDLEITESFFMQDVEVGISILQQLFDAGVHISLDDFGTGYSSLEYLRRLPVNTIKVDRTFITDMHEPASQAIIEMVVMLAQRLGRTTLAEGVETAAHSDRLQELGVETAQGFLFSKPLTPEGFLELVGSALLTP